MLNIYELKRKIVAYVKDDGCNLNIVVTTLKSIISCDVLGLEGFQGICFDHEFFKVCKYMQQHMKKFTKA